MTRSRRDFLRLTGAATAAAGMVGFDEIERVARGALRPAAAGLQLETAPASGKPFRMTQSWYRTQIQRLQNRLGERGMRGIVLKESTNHNYLTGIFLTNTERPVWLWVPTQGELAIFGPGLDRDMYREWFIKDFEWVLRLPTCWTLQSARIREGANRRSGGVDAERHREAGRWRGQDRRRVRADTVTA